MAASDPAPDGSALTEQVTGLAVPLEPLEQASATNLTDINAEMSQSAEVQELVGTLEQQYDAFTTARENSDLLSTEGAVPTAEEIGAEFERFLADQDRKHPRGGE